MLIIFSKMVTRLRVRREALLQAKSFYQKEKELRTPIAPTVARVGWNPVISRTNTLCEHDTRINTNHSAYPDSRDVWSRPKMPVLTTLLSYPDLKGASLSTRGFSEKRDFSSSHQGRPSRKPDGMEFDTPESHECIVRDTDYST